MATVLVSITVSLTLFIQTERDFTINVGHGGVEVSHERGTTVGTDRATNTSCL